MPPPQEAVGQLKEGVVVKAGGVDLVDLLKEGLATPSRIVNLHTIPGLDQLQEDPKGGLRIGPLVTLAHLSADPKVRQHYTALADAAGHAATPQIRNMATVGGNLLQRPRCWYFRHADFHCRKKGGERCFAFEGENAYHALFGNKTCAIVHPSAVAPALIALGARLELTGPRGAREVPLEGFFVAPEQDLSREHSLGPDELITEIRVPAPLPGSRSAYIKQREKESFDWPLADVAVVLELEGRRCKRASVVLGAAAPVPYRARAAEELLVGKSVDEGVAAAAAEAAMQGATPLSQNGYKVPIFKAVVRRTLLAAAGGAS
jgi:xanthine dehydrogenase YagS FAD-binding subunit